MAFEPRGVQGGAALVRERPAHGGTVAPHHVGFRGAPSFETPCEGADPTATLCQFVRGQEVGCINGRRGRLELMAVPEWVGPRGAHRRDGTADGPVAVRNTPHDRPLHGWLDRAQPDRQGLRGR